MKLEFRVDWGYQILYSRRHYHPELRWDGHIECSGGRIVSVHALEYPVLWWGPCHSAIETPLLGASWTSMTRRGLAGIAVIAECDDAAQFTLVTAQGTFCFSVRQIMREGRIVFSVGPKYGNCSLIVTRKGYLWYRPARRPLEVVVEPQQMRGVGVENWGRMDCAWIEPGGTAEFDIALPHAQQSGENRWLLRLHAMAAERRGRPETPSRAYFPMALREGDRTIATWRYYLRSHDPGVAVMHDVWVGIPFEMLSPGEHTLALHNHHPEYALLINRLSLRPKTRRHLQFWAPRWALVGREVIVGLELLHPGTRLRLSFDRRILYACNEPSPEEELAPKRHELRFIALRPALDVSIAVEDLTSGARGEGIIEAIYDLPTENPVVKIGFDMTTVAHDETDMDWLLDYTSRTQLANLVVFRCFNPPPEDDSFVRWGQFCREHDVHAMIVGAYQDGKLAQGAGDHLMAIGAHELSLATYSWDPDNQSRTLREAAERYMEYIRGDVEQTRQYGQRIAYGDAGGGHHYSLLAGADFLRAETMVGHTMTHLSQARGAATTLGSGEWGVHIAIQHCKQPYLESHLGWYYLALMQPWMMGATFLYEEDSLFLLFKEERQTWDDALTKGKRDMTRWFHRFAQTHPRTGHAERRIAVLQGRWAPPFNGFVCGPEQDPSYSVWGKFGRDDPTWGHLQPEKGYQVLDALMPGASTHPLRQRYERRRLYFSGTPYGDFDQVPIDAGADKLGRYALLLLLAWHTMTEPDYAELAAYVRGGGTLLLAVPHLTTHEGREFLADMNDLALLRNGDVRELCGVVVRGKGQRFCGHWTPTGRDFSGAVCPPLSRAPSVSPDEDGPCYLAELDMCGAEAAIVDAISGQPLLTRHRLGSGTVYLMTTWAYPGHEELADLSGAVVADLARRSLGEASVEDPSREVFWTHWPQGKGCGKVMLLNTDWTARGNVKMVTVRTPTVSFSLGVREREGTIVTYLPLGAIVPEGVEPHIEVVGADEGGAVLRAHGTGRRRLTLYTQAGRITAAADGQSVPIRPGPGGCSEIMLRWTQRTVIELELTAQKEVCR